MPNTIADNLQRLTAARTAIGNAIVTKGGTVNSGDGLEEFPADVMSIKNDLTSIDITENGTYYGGEETVVTSSTFPVVVNDSNGTPVRHADVDGNTVQSGTPTPQNPVMPNGTGEITRNLLDYTTVESTSNATATQISGGISVSGQYYVRFRTVQFTVGNTYTMSWKANTISGTPAPSWRFHYSDNTYSSMPSSGGSLIAEKEVSELLLYVSTSASCVVEFTEIMLNLSSTALPYEPYGYKLDISSGGDNLFDWNLLVDGKGIFLDGSVVDDPNRTTTVNAIPVTANSYTLNYTSSEVKFISATYNNDTLINRVVHDSVPDIIDTTGANELRVTLFKTGVQVKKSDISNIMLNRGSTALPYEPYNRITTPVYLGEASTTRKIRKLVLDGTESWFEGTANYYIYIDVSGRGKGIPNSTALSTHTEGGVVVNNNGTALFFKKSVFVHSSLTDFKSYITAQYANGTPVTVWYVLETEETGVVNEPLMKIGDYADSLSVDIELPLSQNAKNNIDIDTTVKPSSASFTYNKLSDYIGYNEINVNVPSDASTLVSKTITENGTYNPADDSADGYSSVVVDVPSAPAQDPKTVFFYDYDGTVVASYTKNEFAALSALPTNPSHTGLTAQGWNWSLADAKEYVAKYGKLHIGQMYVTDDGKTRIYITLTEGRISPILQLYLNDNSALDIDWGDGSTHSTFTTTSAGYVSERHNYATAGDYVIAITVTTGSLVLQSSSTSVSSILWNGNNTGESPDRAYNVSIQKIEIGTGITSIGNNTFRTCYTLKSITIPNSVTTIGTNAFYYCSSLSSITIPDGVTTIGANAFQYCTSLSSITIPNSVTSIGTNIFQYCRSLSTLTLPDSVTSIGIYAFNYCYSLKSITIPDGVTSIGEKAFLECYSLSTLTIPNSVTSIGNYAFSGCSVLKSITIPDGVTSIGEKAFSGCSVLKSITIPNSVTTIGANAFQYCSSVTTLTIPNSVTSIGNNTFSSCYSLTTLTIPNSVTSIGIYAFNYCYSLKSITIGNSVTSIGNCAFQDCKYIESIKFTSTTPPTVSNINAWTRIPKTCIIYVPAGSLDAYKSAANYPNPSTYTYMEY